MRIVKTARGRLTTRHGEDIGRGFPHRGIDIGHGDGQPADLRLVAPAAGYVTAAGPDGTYGNRVIITHRDGTWSLVAHMARILVAVGTWLEQGDEIGVMGNTGTIYVHAHQEYRSPGGIALDPEKYLTSLAGLGPRPINDGAVSRRRKEPTMYVRGTTDVKVIYNLYTDPNGAPRMRVCKKAEAAAAVAGDLVIPCDDATLTMLGQEAGYKFGQPNPLPVVRA